MASQTKSIIQTFIFPQINNLSKQSIEILSQLIEETKNIMSEKQFNFHLNQWKILGKKFNSNSKITFLRHQQCRSFVIELLKEEAMNLFNYSYLNRAKIDSQHIKYLKQLKPHFFIEVILIVSKLKTIHKHFYQKLSMNILQNHIQLKILKILQLCNEKKRSVNNNKAKFLCIVQDQNDRIELTKQLGKMLRQAWAKEKTPKFKNKINDYNNLHNLEENLQLQMLLPQNNSNFLQQEQSQLDNENFFNYNSRNDSPFYI